VPWVNLVRVAMNKPQVRISFRWGQVSCDFWFDSRTCDSEIRPGVILGFVAYFVITMSEDWQKALESLPATPAKIPAFFFAHGSPMLVMNASVGGIMAHQGPTGPLSRFLSHFGPTLLKKYQPKGIVVFSAHWETSLERLGLYYLCRLFKVLINITIFSDGLR